ncbi:MAG: hypothetical protein PHW79_00420 [Candidatus Marinimicrobia bacterium]|nr:hypothetical protein [Candidatus Neomarinimicrobiota bacterium]
MKNISILLMLVFTSLFFTCDSDEKIEATPVIIEITDVMGYDDFSSAGAAFCVATDTVQGISLVAAFQFTLPLNQATFTPETSVKNTIDEYNWNRNNTITTEIKAKYPSLSDFMTDTQGIRTMEIPLAVFVVIPAETDGGSDRVFVATEGNLELTRSDGPGDLIEGDLIFTELTESGADATAKKNGEKISVEDIYFEMSTEVQP